MKDPMIENSAGAAAQRNTLLDVTKYFFTVLTSTFCP